MGGRHASCAASGAHPPGVLDEDDSGRARGEPPPGSGPPTFPEGGDPKVYIHLKPQLVTGSMGEGAPRAKQHLWAKGTALQSIQAAAGPNVPEPLMVVRWVTGGIDNNTHMAE